MNQAEVAIWARGLTKEYNSRTVFRAVDLEIQAGECVGLIGKNGAGKTTLLRCLASLLRPNAGEVRWFGHSIAGCTDLRRLVGMVAHETQLYPELTLHENLLFAARMFQVPQPKQCATEWLGRIGLESFSRYRPTQISRGMRQRVTVARALIHNPKILLFDEPFSALDKIGRDWLMELLQNELLAGSAICFASHDLPNTERLTHRILRLESGRLTEYENTCVRADESGKPFEQAA
jgi:heme ABC exporter ATP-binding subunit CcmA